MLGGTVFFAGLTAAKLGAADFTRRVGAGRAARLACVATMAGNVLLALSPIYLGLAIGRVLAGIGLGLALVLGPVLARQAGGVRLVGVFGGAVMLGTAIALGAGSAMRAAGIDWRLDFALAALVALLALSLLPATGAATVPSGSVTATFRLSLRRLSAWRLELLFTTGLGVPYVLGVWLVPYLTTETGLSAGAAGVVGVALYALCTVLRPEGARLDAEGRSTTAIGGVSPLAAAAGLVLIAVSGGLALSLAGVALVAAGVAIPYATMYDEAEALFPGARIAAVGMFSVGGNVLPLIVMPAIGAAISAGNGETALLALAALPLLAGLANLRPAGG